MTALYNAARVPAMATSAIDLVRLLEKALLKLPQLEISTQHVFHSGMYFRTIHIPKGAIVTGVLIKIPTTLVINGDVSVFLGDGETRFTGYHVISAQAGRKQAVVAHENTDFTMAFATQAKTAEDAEKEFTDETDLLGSRYNENQVTNTGDAPCLDILGP